MSRLIATTLISFTFLVSAPLYADTLTVPAKQQLDLKTPERGMTMNNVEERFGAPKTRHNAVGEPPITRWDYEGYSVYFENQFVLTSVMDLN